MDEGQAKNQPDKQTHPDIGEPIDISREKWRKYHYPEDHAVVILNPMTLHIVPRREGKGRSHRIVDAVGHGWYIKPGWLAIEWHHLSEGPRVNF